MEVALKRTYDAMPEPKLVVALGDCACDGGIFSPECGGGSYATCGKVSNVIPVDVAAPGCPPAPTVILQGILTAISTQNLKDKIGAVK
jgi:Ni,Fe-hydrogenase III small subunit